MVENLEKRSFRPIRVMVPEMQPLLSCFSLLQFWQKVKKHVFCLVGWPKACIKFFFNLMFSGILWCVDYKFHIHFLSNIFVKALEPLENPEFWVDGWPPYEKIRFFKKRILEMKICFLGKAWSKTSKNEVSDRSELWFLRYNRFCHLAPGLKYS